MKKILGLTFLAMLSVNSFAKTCTIASAVENPNDFNNRIFTEGGNTENSLLTYYSDMAEGVSLDELNNFGLRINPG
jgi:hypothetical protein